MNERNPIGLLQALALCATFFFAGCADDPMTSCRGGVCDPDGGAHRDAALSTDSGDSGAHEDSEVLVDGGCAGACEDSPPSQTALLAATPPMGWNSWNHFACNVSDTLIRGVADAIVSSGMKDAGYLYVNIDDCWQTGRGADGSIQADGTRFPNGIRPLADYVHGLGLKFGVYTDAGTATCQGRPGSYGHEDADMLTYRSWGVDYVKVDWCNSDGLDPRMRYGIVQQAIARSNGELILSICNWGVDSPWEWGPRTGQLWRTTGDISDSWASMIGIADSSSRHAAVAGPGHWNDPDMLEVGNGGMSDAEYRAHMSLWAVMAAPLIAGNDVRSMTEATAAILMNPDVIAIDQDPAGIQGTRVVSQGDLEVWVRPLDRPGARAVALLNRGATNAVITARWADVGLGDGPATVRDLWAHSDLGSFTGSFGATVPSHGVVFVRIDGDEPVAPRGTAYIEALTWTYTANGWGPPGRAQSNGEALANDGHPIAIRARSYSHGVGVHAESDLRVRLGGGCTRFAADVGVDDEAALPGASMVFQVWLDGHSAFDSGRLGSSHPAMPIDLDVTGAQELRLVVTGAGDSVDFDHGDWADARLTCAP